MKINFNYKFKIKNPVVICYISIASSRFYLTARAKAFCSEHDSFNIEKGKELALARAKELVIKKSIKKLHRDRIKLNKSRFTLDSDILDMYRMSDSINKHRTNIEHNYGLEY